MTGTAQKVRFHKAVSVHLYVKDAHEYETRQQRSGRRVVFKNFTDLPEHTAATLKQNESEYSRNPALTLPLTEEQANAAYEKELGDHGLKYRYDPTTNSIRKIQKPGSTSVTTGRER